MFARDGERELRYALALDDKPRALRVYVVGGEKKVARTKVRQPHPFVGKERRVVYVFAYKVRKPTHVPPVKVAQVKRQ